GADGLVFVRDSDALNRRTRPRAGAGSAQVSPGGWRMRSIALSVGLCLLAWTGAMAGEDCPLSRVEKARQEVDGLLAKWKAATAELQKLCPDTRASLDSELASVSSECPIGSRVTQTIRLVDQALAAMFDGKGECCAEGEA